MKLRFSLLLLLLTAAPAWVRAAEFRGEIGTVYDGWTVFLTNWYDDQAQPDSRSGSNRAVRIFRG